MSLCPSVCPLVPFRFPLNGFASNLILEINWLKSVKNIGNFTWKANYFCIVDSEMCSSKVGRKGTDHRMSVSTLGVLYCFQTYLVFHVMCTIFLSDFNQIWGFWRSFMLFTPHKISFGLSNQEKWDGRACSTYGGEERTYRILVGKPEGRRPPGRPKQKWDDNIKKGIREVGWSMDWIDVV